MPFRRIRSTSALVLSLLFILSVLIPAGCAPKLAPEPAWEKNARDLLDQADSLFAKKQYDQSAKIVEVFFARFPKSTHRDRALYRLGEVRLMQRNYPQALSDYKEIIEKFPSSPFIIQSRYKLGLCYFEIKEYDLAIANLEDRSKITDPAQLRRIAEVLTAAYTAKKNFLPAVRELTLLAETEQNDRNRTGYRDRIREFVDKNLTEAELRTLADGSKYPSDIARLRLAALLIEQRQYREAVSISKDFLEKFPAHPERMRGEMLLSEATSKLSSPQVLSGRAPASIGPACLLRRPGAERHPARGAYLQSPGARQPGRASGEGHRRLAGQGRCRAHRTLVQKHRSGHRAVAHQGGGSARPRPRKTEGPRHHTGGVRREYRNAQPLAVPKRAHEFDPGSGGRPVRARTQTQKSSWSSIRTMPTAGTWRASSPGSWNRRPRSSLTVAYPPEVKDFGPYVRKIIEIDLRSRQDRHPGGRPREEKALR